MKATESQVNMVRSALVAALGSDNIKHHYQKLYALTGKHKSVRWALFWHANDMRQNHPDGSPLSRLYAGGLNDSHIDTLLRKLMPPSMAD